MMRTSSPTSKSRDGRKCQYAIRLSPEAECSSRREEMCQELLRLGGAAIAGGFAFLTAGRRAAVFDILCDSYGSRYFEPFDRTA